MGHEVLYCGKCRTQLRGVQFESGKAVRVGGQAFCSSCAPHAEPAPKAPIVEAPRLATTTPRGGQRTIPAPRSASVLPFVGAGAGVVLVLIAIAAVAGGKKSAPKQPAQAGSAEEAAAPDPPPDSSPASRPPERSSAPASSEVPKRAAPVAKASPEESDAAAVDADTRSACREENFRRAFEVLDQARPRHSTPEWAGLLDRRFRDVTQEAETLFARLKGEAIESRRKGEAAKVRELQDRVSKWGVDRFRSDLDKALAAAAPERPPPAPELAAFRKQWEAAMEAACVRNFAGASAELQNAQKALREEPLRAEAVADLEVVRSVESMVAEALQAVLKGPKGRKVTLSSFDESGAVRKAEGTLLRVEGRRLDLRTPEGPVSVEFGELLPACVIDLFLARPAKKPATDARAAALFSLLEGDVEGARKLQSDGIPEKYWALGARAAERRAHPDRRETEARKLFFAAEAEVRNPSTAAEAAEKYASLLKDHADTAFVRRNRPSLAVRGQTGKEYFFFPEDLVGGGSFQLAKASKVEACWMSLSDSPPERVKENFVELTFSTLPNVEYRAWTYVGGCCGETLTCHLQATDVAAPHPKTKELTAAEPGSDFWVPLKHTLSTATRLHQAHSGPKQPVRWGWVSLPLPKFAAAGVKKARVVTDQQGFAVAYAFVSAVKTAPPKDPELKELEKERAERVGERGALAPPDATLVAHWKCDDKGGAAAFDASGRGNTASLVNGPAATAGKFGGALAFDGVDDYASVPHSASIDLGAEGQSYSISVWYKRSGPPSGTRAIIGKNDGEGPYPFDLLVNKSGQAFFVVWDGVGGGQMPVLSNQVVTDGAWHHVLAVRDAGAKMLRLYVDGTEAPAVSDTSKGSLKNTDTVWMARNEMNKKLYNDAAALDDVRLYARLLGATEAQALTAGRPPR